METRSNHVLVGVVTLTLLALLAAFIIWLAGLNRGETKEYEILFPQSVDGLAVGSSVTFSGVPVGQVTVIEIYENDPDYARVEIEIDDVVPIHIGAVATIQSSFTGVAKIQLSGGNNQQPEISCETTACGRREIPQIPPEAGGLGQILASAPVLLDRLATLTDRMNQMLSDENQQSITGILNNTERLTGEVADAMPTVEATLTQLQTTLAEADGAINAFESTMQTTDDLMKSQGEELITQLRTTLTSLTEASNALKATLDDAGPATARVANETLPAVEEMMRELRDTSSALRDITEKLDSQGAGALLGGSDLPDYEP